MDEQRYLVDFIVTTEICDLYFTSEDYLYMTGSTDLDEDQLEELAIDNFKDAYYDFCQEYVYKLDITHIRKCF